MLEPAPFYADVADGPAEGQAHWIKTLDDVRLRMGHWPLDAAAGPARGTVLVFNGRTEFIEKYGQLARDFAAAGFATATVDWRGQGLSDRPTADYQLSHIRDFAEYQTDAAAFLDAVQQVNLPEPYVMLGHSMGGAIGLEALRCEFPVRAAFFSAPMWGLDLSPALRPVAWALSWTASLLGRGTGYTLGRTPDNYLEVTPFEGNDLTADPALFEAMRQQVVAHADLGLGGPSWHWLLQALIEARRLRRAEVPDLPIVAAIGGAEEIVDAQAVRAMAAKWPWIELYDVPGARHELLMEAPETRQAVRAKMISHFQQHSTARDVA